MLSITANYPDAAKKPGDSIRSPQDKRRYRSWYSADLDPETLGTVLNMAELGNLSPLQEVGARIRGRDGIVEGLTSTRLAAVSGCQVRVKPNPHDDPQASIEAALFVEKWLFDLKLIRRTLAGVEEAGELPEVLESIASVFYSGIQPLWLYYHQAAGDPWLTPYGIEAIEPYRIKLDPRDQTIAIDTQNNGQQGEPLAGFSPLLWVSVTAQRAGVPLCYAGAVSKILFPWWLSGLSDENLAKYLDRFGLPIPIGKLPPKDAITGGYTGANFDDMVKEIHGDNLGMTIPGAASLTVFSAPAGGEKLFDSVRSTCERRLNYILAGQTGTNLGEGGSLAKAKVNYAIRGDLIQRDRQVVGSALRRLASRALFFYFRGPTKSVPLIEVYDPSEEAAGVGPKGTPQNVAT